MNVYSNSSHSALKYLKDTEVNIDNVLIMAGDFNIRDSLWDISFPHHSSISDDLLIIADSFNLTLSSPTNPCVKIVNGGLSFYFLFLLYFIFSFLFLFFSIFKTTQVRVYQSHCHISHKLMAKSQD